VNPDFGLGFFVGYLSISHLTSNKKTLGLIVKEPSRNAASVRAFHSILLFRGLAINSRYT